MQIIILHNPQRGKGTASRSTDLIPKTGQVTRKNQSNRVHAPVGVQTVKRMRTTMKKTQTRMMKTKTTMKMRFQLKKSPKSQMKK